LNNDFSLYSCQQLITVNSGKDCFGYFGQLYCPKYPKKLLYPSSRIAVNYALIRVSRDFGRSFIELIRDMNRFLFVKLFRV
jgi:hypothetical protein